MGKRLTYEEVYLLFTNCGYELLEKEYINAITKMKYKCPNHPDKDTSIRVADLNSGIRCPYCSGKGRSNIIDIRDEFNSRGYELLENDYINNKTKMAYRCKKHPDEIQYVRYDSFSNRNQGCKYCGVESMKEKTKLSLEYVKNEFKNVGYELLESEYHNNKQKLRYICPNHPEKETFIDYSSFQQGVRCPFCAGTNNLTYDEVKSLFESKNYTLLEKDYANVDTYMKCYCNLHPEYIQYVRTHTLKRGYRCSYCAGKKATYATSLGNNFPDLIEEWSSRNILTPFEVLPKSNKQVWWKCSECNHEWETRIADRVGKQSGCPVCHESKGEKRIREWINVTNISLESQKEFDGLLGVGGGNLSYDFYLPSFNYLLEYQGEQHNHFIKGIHGNRENFKKQQEHDKRKREYAEQNNIKLLEIWYWDFDNIEEILGNEFSEYEIQLVI